MTYIALCCEHWALTAAVDNESGSQQRANNWIAITELTQIKSQTTYGKRPLALGLLGLFLPICPTAFWNLPAFKKYTRFFNSLSKYVFKINVC